MDSNKFYWPFGTTVQVDEEREELLLFISRNILIKIKLIPYVGGVNQTHQCALTSLSIDASPAAEVKMSVRLRAIFDDPEIDDEIVFDGAPFGQPEIDILREEEVKGLIVAKAAEMNCKSRPQLYYTDKYGFIDLFRYAVRGKIRELYRLVSIMDVIHRTPQNDKHAINSQY